MRSIFTLVLIAWHVAALSQSSTFKEQWNTTRYYMHFIDSSCSSVSREHHSFMRKAARQVYTSPADSKMKHVVKTRYRHGNIVVKERYRISHVCKIKLLQVNGQLMMVRSAFHNRKNFFINYGDSAWRWIYRTGETRQTIYDAGKVLYRMEKSGI